MTYMEIATYLGMTAEMLRQAWMNDPSPDTKETLDKLREAIMQAQLIMYEMARRELKEEQQDDQTKCI